MKISTERSRKFKIKEPGSAITHFIGCVMALLGSAAAAYKGGQRAGPYSYDCHEYFHIEYDTFVCGQHDLPYRRFYREGEPEAAENGPHDDFYFDCRKLHAGVSDCSAGKNRDYALCSSVDGCIHRNCC